MLKLTAKYWRVLAILFIAVVWAASLWPTIDLKPLRFAHADKLEHLVAYALLAYLLVRGWPRVGWWWLWLVAMLCGGAAELGQAFFTTTRHPDWWDMLANTLGAGIGLLLARLTWLIGNRTSE